MCGLNQSHVFIGAITDRYELIRSELETKPIFAQRSEHTELPRSLFLSYVLEMLDAIVQSI